MTKNNTKISWKGIAFAMGVVVIVMSTLKTLDLNAGVSMLQSSVVRARSSIAAMAGCPIWSN